MKCKMNKKTARAALALTVVAAILITAAAVMLATFDNDARPFSAEFAVRDTVYTPRETKGKTETTARPRGDAEVTTAEAEETTAALAGMSEGAFRCRIDMPKTAWEAGEVPTFKLSFGLLDQSYGSGRLILHIESEDLALSEELCIDDYIYDIHAIDGKTMPDVAELSLIRTKNEDSFAFGRLYLYFEFIPDIGNTSFGDEWSDTYYDDWDDWDDMEPGAEDDLWGDLFTRHGLWVGGYACAYAITPCGIRLARQDVSADAFFAETAVMQYKKGDLTDTEFADAYWSYALPSGVYIHATSPILSGGSTLTYISPGLRATTRRAVTDADVLKMVAECGPFYDEPNEDATVERAAGRNLAFAILSELLSEGVITDAQYEAEMEYAEGAQNYYTAPPAIDRGFKKYSKLIKENTPTQD